MKKIMLIRSLILIVFGTVFFFDISKSELKTQLLHDKLSEKSQEELYQDVFVTLLLPYIQEAVNNYYKEVENPGVAPYFVDVLSVVRPDGYRTFDFIIKLEVTPYIGAHNAIGLDHVTITIELGEPKVTKFEHIKSY